MCTPDAAAEKARLRREMLRIRRRISGAEREAASRRIEAGVREWLMRRSVQSVFCYVSYAEEVETYRLLQWMAAQGIAVSVPRVQEADMQAVHWAPGCPMRPNRWGIPEPVDMPRAQGAELAILPNTGGREAHITIREGKFHQIKRMMAYLGKPVLYLERVRMGNLTLDSTLPRGSWRFLTEDEVRGLEIAVGEAEKNRNFNKK